MKNDDYFCVIGYVDAYGAVHYKKLRLEDEATHEWYWPTNTHKRWRFNISEWSLDQSVLSGVRLDDEDGIRVIEKMRKILTPPRWVIEGEEWEKAGRPR